MARRIKVLTITAILSILGLAGSMLINKSQEKPAEPIFSVESTESEPEKPVDTWTEAVKSKSDKAMEGSLLQEKVNQAYGAKLLGYNDSHVNFCKSYGSFDSKHSRSDSRHIQYATFQISQTEQLKVLIPQAKILMTQTKYDISYQMINKDVAFNAEKFVHTFVSESYSTMDNIRLDRNLDAVLTSIKEYKQLK